MPRKEKTPATYLCAHCGRRLLIDTYRVDVIAPDAEPERIHRQQESWTAGFTLLCTCGHYTVVTRWRPNPV
jgi:predicted RNA-binding Zn-ribbon protein involved in translation (DUF1610 family)